MEDRFSPLVNRGENAVRCRSICEATGTEAFAKICIADAVRVEALGIPDSLYKYALKAHFDILVSKNNKAYLAIEFDGSGYDGRNDKKKAAICNFFNLPMIRIKKSHLEAMVFEDTAVGFFIWQLFCVDAFLGQYGIRGKPTCESGRGFFGLGLAVIRSDLHPGRDGQAISTSRY